MTGLFFLLFCSFSTCYGEKIEEPRELMAHLSCLFWAPYRDGIGLYSSSLLAAPSDALPPKESPLSILNYGYFGCRLGLSYLYNREAFSLIYTWFGNKKDRIAKKYSGGSVVSYQKFLDFQTENDIYLQSSNVDPNRIWSNSFSRIDCLFTYNCIRSGMLDLNLTGGILVAWDTDLFYEASKNEEVGYVRSIDTTQFWWGIGPSFGFAQKALYFYREVGYFYLSAYQGIGSPWSFAVVERAVCNPTQDGNNAYQVKSFSRYAYNAIMPLLETRLAVGFKYSFAFLNIDNVEIAWEQQNWFDHYHSPLGYSSSGNYSTGGLTLTFSLGF